MKGKPKQTVGIRIELDLIEKIKEEAKKNNMTLSKFLENLIYHNLNSDPIHKEEKKESIQPSREIKEEPLDNKIEEEPDPDNKKKRFPRDPDTVFRFRGKDTTLRKLAASRSETVGKTIEMLKKINYTQV